MITPFRILVKKTDNLALSSLCDLEELNQTAPCFMTQELDRKFFSRGKPWV